jgi:anti-sigma factor RsiW
VYILHLSELAVPCGDHAHIVAAGAARVLNALPPRRRSALFGRDLPFRVVVVDGDCCPVLVIQPDMITVFAARHGRLNDGA